VGGEQAFFSFAAGIIPALTFGGLLTDRLKPPDETKLWHLITLFVSASLLLFAELTAIRAAATGEVDPVGRAIVAFALFAVTAGILLLLIFPWIDRIPMRRDHAVLTKVSTSFGLIIFAGIAAVVVSGSIRWSSTVESFEKERQVRLDIVQLEQRRDDLIDKQYALAQRRDGTKPNTAERRVIDYLSDRLTSRISSLDIEINYQREEQRRLQDDAFE
jgi:hypothetical protein